MPLQNTLQKVYINLIADSRVNVWHCSIYMALIFLWYENGFTNPFPISRKAIMKLAHINSIVTYHKCIKQLEEFGYVQYNPSYSYYERSTILLRDLQN